MNFQNADDFNRVFCGMQESFGDDDKMAFIDYEGDGQWIFGIMNPRTHTITEVLDADTCIHILARRAVEGWGADPDELWLSPCAAILALLGDGMKV
jgi:hypothetical protein